MAETILISDDDHSICTVLEAALTRKGYQVQITDNPAELLRWVQDGAGDAVITDVMMPKGNGLELLSAIRAQSPHLPVLVISARNTLMTAVEASKRGAFEYHPKPFDLNALMMSLEHALKTRAITDAALPELPGEIPLIGRSPAMQLLYKSIARLVGVDLTVTIHGESGTGKELVARALHSLGARKSHPFVAVNMAAIPKELVESELFGHEKGAFTGAAARKAGKFEQAEGGTLFLDEIGDMPLDAQTKLLRVLQQGEYIPVGGIRAKKTNVRIVCATHRDLWELTSNGAFREDLYYRLHVVPITVPPLRERREDIPELAEFFLRAAAGRGLPRKTLDKKAVSVLTGYPWPGNVRELENMLYRLAVLRPENELSAAIIQEELAAHHANDVSNTGGDSLETLVHRYLAEFFHTNRHHAIPAGLHDRILAMVERPLITLALQHTGNNQIKTASLLGINRNTLRKKMQDLGITGGKK